MKDSVANKPRGLGRMIAAGALTASLVFAQSGVPGGAAPMGGQIPAQELTIRARFDETKVVTADESIEITLSRALTKDEHLAVLIGATDLTELFSANGSHLRYDAKLLPLPLGNSPVVVYQVRAGGEWQELAHFVLSVVKEKPAKQPKNAAVKTGTNAASTEEKIEAAAAVAGSSVKTTVPETGTQPSETPAPAAETTSSPGAQSETSPAAKGDATPQPTPKPLHFGLEKLEGIPSIAFNIKSQPLQANFPANNRPAERATFTDFTVQGSLKTEMQRGPLGAQTQFDFAGSSVQQEALRFGTLGNKAPRIDLASYTMQLSIGKAKLQAGQTSFGADRFVINSFSSRGLTLTLPLTKWLDFSAGALNGTSVVGLPNFLGVARRQHQLQGATLGFEFLPKRPGGLRLEVTAMNGYVQPLSGFSQGSVNDAERSKGLGARFVASDSSGRFKLEAGLAVSRFQNPRDTLLDPDGKAVPLPPISRTAHYVESSFQILRNLSVTRTKKVNLGFSFKHELVNPLFRSLGASPSADKTQEEYLVDGSIGEITIQAGRTQFNDNIKDVPSILKSLTRANRFSLAVPLASLFGDAAKPSPLWPRLAYSLDRTHQFGAAIPAKGGFETDLSAIPNQVATNQTFGSDWQLKKFTTGYSYNRSLTDNRQPGRERADLLNQTNTARVGFTPLTILNFGVDLSRDSANDLGSAKLLHTWRVGTTGTWNLNKRMTWSGSISNTIAGDREQTSNSRNTEFDTQFAFRAGLERGRWQKVQTQMFIRYANRYARLRDLSLSVTNLTRVQIMNAGLTVAVF